MMIVEKLAELQARKPGSSPVCFIVPAANGALAEQAARAMHMDHEWPGLSARPRHRPNVGFHGDGIAALAFATDESQESVAVHLRASGAGLTIVAPGSVLAGLRPAVQQAEDDAPVALVAILLELGRQVEERLDDLTEAAREVEARATGYTSGPERGELSRMRARLFGLRQLYAAQHRLLAQDEDLALAIPPAGQRLLRRARGAIEDSEAIAEHVYAMLGDVLAEQSRIVNERLTLVATFFLPLTVSTGFFGMNFSWMTDRVGTLSAFALLGVAVPVLLVAGTLAVVRRLSGPGPPRTAPLVPKSVRGRARDA
jgi:hypothetical protein